MEVWWYELCIRGYHIYKEEWQPSVSEEVLCRREAGNVADPHLVAIARISVGHIPREISAIRETFSRGEEVMVLGQVN